MAAVFNSADRDSWYFGKLSRVETQERLMKQKHGTFLVRDSKTCPGDYVLSVSENSKVSHYIINSMQNRLKIGDQVFESMPELLDFYKIHYLDTTTLIEPLSKTSALPTANNHLSFPSAIGTSTGVMPGDSRDQSKDDSLLHAMPIVRAMFDFKSDDTDDLPFSKGELLEVIEKPEENWWNARNAQGRIGQIPVPYIEVFNPNKNSAPGVYQQPGVNQQSPQARPISMPTAGDLPVHAEVVTKRVPNAYDPTALALEVGDVVKVTKMNRNGQWEGILTSNRKQGWFPFTHVKIIDKKQ